MPPWFHRTVRPLLERIGMLVFFLALVRCPELIQDLLRPGCTPPRKATLNQLEELVHVLECHAMLDPAALDVPFSGALPFRERMNSHRHCNTRRTDDGWGRPIMVRRLPSSWLLELRSAGPDGQLDTHDDQYAWFDADRHALYEDELEQATLEAAILRTAAAWTGDAGDCRVLVRPHPWRHDKAVKNTACDTLLALRPS